MKRLLKTIVKFVLLSAILGAAGQALSRKCTSGDETSDEFSLAAIFGGIERASTASALRSGQVIICLGGVDLDLRGATLDPAGARLDLKLCVGGIQVSVPPDWRVEVTRDVIAGGVDVDVTPHEDLPADAPRLELSVTARVAGVAVTTRPRTH